MKRWPWLRGHGPIVPKVGCAPSPLRYHCFTLKSLLIRNARRITTCVADDPARSREWHAASVLVRGSRIEAIGPAADLALFDLRTLGLAGAVVHDPVGAMLLRATPWPPAGSPCVTANCAGSNSGRCSNATTGWPWR